MCTVCDAAMDAVTDNGHGATAFAWDRADAAIRAWRATVAADFDDVLGETEAWAEHMASTQEEADMGALDDEIRRSGDLDRALRVVLAELAEHDAALSAERRRKLATYVRDTLRRVSIHPVN